MNKKVIAMAVTAALAAPMIAQASDISFKGDARYRWGQIEDSNGNSLPYNTGIPAVDALGSNTGVDNRVRIVATAKMDGGVEATTRMISDVGTVTTDYAYITAPLMGGMATLKAGDQLASWGIGLAIKDDKKAERLNLTVPLGAWKAFVNYDPGAGKGGLPSYGAVGKAGSFTTGLLIFGVDGKGMDIFAKGAAGPVGLAFEYNSVDAGAKKPTGMALMGKYPMGGINIDFGYASAADGFIAHKKFKPLSTIGLDQKTGLMDFGTGGDQTAIVVGADLMAGPGRVTAMVGSLNNSTTSTSGTALDLKYDVGVFGITYGTVDMGASGKYTAVGSEINVKF